MEQVNSYIFKYEIIKYDAYGSVWSREDKRLLIYATKKSDAMAMFRAWSSKHKGLIDINIIEVIKDNKQGYEPYKTLEYIQKQKDFINNMSDVYNI